jgi:hypothetical protein
LTFVIGPDDHDVPTGIRIRERSDQLVIHALVHHAEEPEDWTIQRGDIFRGDSVLAERLAEVVDIDTAPKAVTISVTFALGFVDFRAAGKHDIRNGEQFVLPADELRRRASELGKLIHAIIDDRTLLHLPGERCDGHRIIKPLHRTLKLPAQGAGERGFDQPPLLRIERLPILQHGRWKLCLQDNDVRKIGQFSESRARSGDPFLRHRLLDEEDGMPFRKSGKELLRPLPHPIPAEMRVNDDRKSRLRVSSRPSLPSPRGRLARLGDGDGGFGWK